MNWRLLFTEAMASLKYYRRRTDRDGAEPGLGCRVVRDPDVLRGRIPARVGDRIPGRRTGPRDHGCRVRPASRPAVCAPAGESTWTSTMWTRSAKPCLW